MELKGTCYAISWLENKIIRELVSQGKAKYIGTVPKGIENGKTENSKFFTKSYQIHVGDSMSTIAQIFEIAGDVRVKFWYDMRADYAGVKTSREGFLLIFNSPTVERELKRIKFKITNKDNKVDPEKIKELVQYAIKATGGKEQVSINVDLE